MPVPRPSPQGTAEALPYLILRHLSSEKVVLCFPRNSASAQAHQAPSADVVGPERTQRSASIDQVSSSLLPSSLPTITSPYSPNAPARRVPVVCPAPPLRHPGDHHATPHTRSRP